MPSFDYVERKLSWWFFKYGRFVSHHPLPFITAPVLLTLIASFGFLYLDPISDAVYLFTPVDAPSKVERQVIHDLWPLVNGSFVPGRAVTQSREVQVTVTARDEGNILEKPFSDAINRLEAYIQNQVSVTYEGRRYRYKDLCLWWRTQGCPGNKHFQIISGLYQQGFNITYPTVRFAHMNGYIGSSLGGVFVAYTDKNEMILRKARSWLMLYQMQFYPSSMSHISGLWEKAFQRAIERYPLDPHISITYIHSQTLAEELKRNADTLVPRFITAFAILALFSVACNLSMIDGRLFIDWVVSKPSLAVLGVFNAGMGVATAIGGLSLIGFPYNDIVGVMPFLVVAVGTDNMFLMVASIRGTNRGHPWDLRIGECMSDAAISMFITALTDAFSFGIGTITTIPAVQIFCVYTCVALAVNFIYQISFFCGLLSLAVQWEAEGLHSVWLRPTVHKKFLDGAGFWTKLFWMGSRADSEVDRPQESSAANKFFRDWFGTVLTQPAVRMLVVLWYFIYLAFAIYGWTQVREGLEPVNLLVEDSYAIPHYRVLEKYFWHHGPSVQIVVSNPPDLRSAEERVRMRHMVHAFANNKHAIGDESAQFWMFEMERYYRDVMKMNVTDDAYYGLAQHFINERSTDYWSEDIKWARLPDGNITIAAYRFLVGMRDISSSVEQQDATSTFREVASRYARYNVTTFMPLWLFTDQYALVVPNIVQDIVIAIVVMIIIALILIPQPSCALWVALAIASIDTGVIGLMTLWGVNLDAISMITIVMSVGFAVDYSAHMAYGYVTSKEELVTARVQHALGALGPPLTQGALSTILAVVVLADIPAYTIRTFVKTVFLSISIGLLHGLIFLPVALSLFVRGSPSKPDAPKTPTSEFLDGWK